MRRRRHELINAWSFRVWSLSIYHFHIVTQREHWCGTTTNEFDVNAEIVACPNIRQTREGGFSVPNASHNLKSYAALNRNHVL